MSKDRPLLCQVSVSETIKEKLKSELNEKTKEHVEQKKWRDYLKAVDEFVETIEKVEVSQSTTLLFSYAPLSCVVQL